MQTIAITVNVPAVELTEENIREAVIEKIAAMTLGLRSVRHYDDETGEEWTSQQVPALAHMKEQAQQHVASLVKEHVEREIPAIVSDVLAGEYQPTTKWGEKDGGPITLRAMIGKVATDYYNAKLDPQGRVATGYNSDKGTPRIEWLIKQAVEEAYKSTIEAEVKAIADTIRPLMAEKINGEIRTIVDRILGRK